jgi:hypothetical protein
MTCWFSHLGGISCIRTLLALSRRCGSSSVWWLLSFIQTGDWTFSSTVTADCFTTGCIGRVIHALQLHPIYMCHWYSTYLLGVNTHIYLRGPLSLLRGEETPMRAGHQLQHAGMRFCPSVKRTRGHQCIGKHYLFDMDQSFFL